MVIADGQLKLGYIFNEFSLNVSPHIVEYFMPYIKGVVYGFMA
jgi:hypothetical protein